MNTKVILLVIVLVAFFYIMRKKPSDATRSPLYPYPLNNQTLPPPEITWSIPDWSKGEW